MLQTPADVFDLTIDTSDGGVWCDLLEKTVSNRWGLLPSPMETPPTSPDPSPLVLSGGARGDVQGRTICGYAVECLLFSASVAVGVGSWLWMLKHVALDAQSYNQTVVEAMLEWQRYGDDSYWRRN